MKNNKNFFRVVAVLIVLGVFFVFFFGSFTRRFFASVVVVPSVGNNIVAVAKVNRVNRNVVVNKVAVRQVLSDVAVAGGHGVGNGRVVVG